jgi:hypothetical protein
MKIDRNWLKQFCGNQPFREYINEPFSQDGFTWATDGVIMLRVDHIASLGPCPREGGLNVSKPLVGIEKAAFTCRQFSFPPAPSKRGMCMTCDGRGTEHTCPDCTCKCDDCNGSGDADPELQMSTIVSGRIFNLSYVRKVSELPNVEIADCDGEIPMWFRFDGGYGALMPMRGEFSEHITIEGSSVSSHDGSSQ